MTTEEKLNHFLEHCLQDAQHKSDAMLKEYSDALEQMFQEHIEDRERQMNLRIQTETDHLNRECNKALAKEQIAMKHIISEKQEELKSMLFAEVKDLLENYTAGPDYLNLLIKQIQEASKFADSKDITIYIDPADSSHHMYLETATKTRLTVSEYSFMGGIRAVIPSKKILIDNAFATKLEEAKETFRFEGGEERAKNRYYLWH